MRVAYLFEIFQNAAVQLVHRLQALLTQVNSCFFTAYATCTKTHHGFALQVVQVRLSSLGEVAEFIDIPVDSPLKTAFLHFKRVTRVQCDHGAALVVLPCI